MDSDPLHVCHSRFSGCVFRDPKGALLCQGGSVYTWSRTTLFILLPRLPRRTVLMMSLLLVAPSLSLAVSCWVNCERKSRYKASIIHCQAKEGLKFCQVRSLFREILGAHIHSLRSVQPHRTRLALPTTSLTRFLVAHSRHDDRTHTQYMFYLTAAHGCLPSRACDSTPPGVGPVPSQITPTPHVILRRGLSRP